MKFDKIPEELKALKQWVVWRYVLRETDKKATKQPFSAITGRAASSTNSETWCTFETAAALAESRTFDGIGFVLTSNDPYTFIDLDDPKDSFTKQKNFKDVYSSTVSYAEKSPSGRGIHIICKGNVPCGRNKNGVEIYSEQRYMTMTGDVFRDVPISDEQDFVSRLWVQLSPDLIQSKPAIAFNKPQSQSDKDVVLAAFNAQNGDFAKALFKGEWEGIYGSRSQAAFALVDIIAYYTKNLDQIKRIFRRSGFKDTKHADDYHLELCLRKAFDNQPPEVDADALFEKARQIRQEESLTIAPEEVLEIIPAAASPGQYGFDGCKDIVFPRGLVGEIAEHIYKNSARPIRIISLAGALALVAGIAGGSYSISKTGLNLYMLVIAQTGSGKEDIAKGINSIVSAIKPTAKAIESFIGPGRISSGQALIRHLQESKSFVSVIGEVGYIIQQLSAPILSPNNAVLKSVLVDLYSKSGPGSSIKPSIYADSSKNTEEILSPAVTIVGESAPSIIYNNLDETVIRDGMLNRFLILEYDGPHVYLNEKLDEHEDLNETFTNKIASLVAHANEMIHLKQHIAVGMTSEVQELNRAYHHMITDKMNSKVQEGFKDLWVRAHLKLIKVAAILAVGRHMYKPIIDVEDFNYAKDLIEHEITSLVTKWSRGDIGASADENKQTDIVVNLIKNYIKNPYKDSYQFPKMLHERNIIPSVYLQRNTSNVTSFKRDPLRAKVALEKCIVSLINEGSIREIKESEAFRLTGVEFGGKFYIIGNPERFI